MCKTARWESGGACVNSESACSPYRRHLNKTRHFSTENQGSSSISGWVQIPNTLLLCVTVALEERFSKYDPETISSTWEHVWMPTLSPPPPRPTESETLAVGPSDLYEQTLQETLIMFRFETHWFGEGFSILARHWSHLGSFKNPVAWFPTTEFRL